MVLVFCVSVVVSLSLGLSISISISRRLYISRHLYISRRFSIFVLRDLCACSDLLVSQICSNMWIPLSLLFCVRAVYGYGAYYYCPRASFGLFEMISSNARVRVPCLLVSVLKVRWLMPSSRMIDLFVTWVLQFS